MCEARWFLLTEIYLERGEKEGRVVYPRGKHGFLQTGNKVREMLMPKGEHRLKSTSQQSFLSLFCNFGHSLWSLLSAGTACSCVFLKSRNVFTFLKLEKKVQQRSYITNNLKIIINYPYRKSFLTLV